jgi:predicted transcriptional regulator
LRKTAVTLCKVGEGTAEEVADRTKRARAVESSYLNQLVRMGYLKKERRGRKAYFYVEKESSGENPWEK